MFNNRARVGLCVALYETNSSPVGDIYGGQERQGHQRHPIERDQPQATGSKTRAPAIGRQSAERGTARRHCACNARISPTRTAQEAEQYGRLGAVTRPRMFDVSHRAVATSVAVASTMAEWFCRVSLTWEQVIIDSIAPVDLGLWWCDALGWVVVNDDPDEFEIRPDCDRMPGLLFALVPGARAAVQRQQRSPVTTAHDLVPDAVAILDLDTTFAGNGHPGLLVFTLSTVRDRTALTYPPTPTTSDLKPERRRSRSPLNGALHRIRPDCCVT
jgi:hypothetical protein